MRWFRDGHTVKIGFEGGSLYTAFVCPVDVEAREPVESDECRVEYDESGQRVAGAPPLTYCNFGESFDFDSPSEFLYDGCDRFEVTVSPVPVAVAWDSAADCYAWAPVAWLDAQDGAVAS